MCAWRKMDKAEIAALNAKLEDCCAVVDASPIHVLCGCACVCVCVCACVEQDG